jgi:hypothetical protein
MNWGHKIAILYGGFATFIIGMVVICVRQTDIHLVSPEYYKEEIAYQAQIDRLHNAQQLKQPLQLTYQAQSGLVQLQFPVATPDLNGTVLFFRPSDAHQDVKFTIHADAAGQQSIPVNQLSKGLWKVKINWNQGGKAYLQEQTLVI